MQPKSNAVPGVSSPIIVQKTVISDPGATLKVVAYSISPSVLQALSVGNAKVPTPPIDHPLAVALDRFAVGQGSVGQTLRKRLPGQ